MSLSKHICTLGKACPNLMLEGGLVIQRGNSVGDLARFECGNDAQLLGNNVRECQSRGHWSGIMAQCFCEQSRGPSLYYFFLHAWIKYNLNY